MKKKPIVLWGFTPLGYKLSFASGTSRLNPPATGVTIYLLSGTNHQVGKVKGQSGRVGINPLLSGVS